MTKITHIEFHTSLDTIHGLCSAKHKAIKTASCVAVVNNYLIIQVPNSIIFRKIKNTNSQFANCELP